MNSSRRRRILLIALEAGVPLAVLAVWWVWSAGADSFYFPALPEILTTFGDTWLFERVGSDVVPSLARLAAGFGIAVVAGIAIGTALGLSPAARRVAGPIVEFGRAVPPPALLPFGMLVLGVGDAMKVFVIAVVCLWPILLNTVDGVRGVDPTMLDTARVYGIGGVQRLRRIVWPSALPQVFAGMRTSLSLALILMVISEMVASTEGIGYFVLESQRSFAIPEMWSGIVLLGVLGYLLNAALALVERRVLRWHRGAKGSALR